MVFDVVDFRKLQKLIFNRLWILLNLPVIFLMCSLHNRSPVNVTSRFPMLVFKLYTRNWIVGLHIGDIPRCFCMCSSYVQTSGNLHLIGFGMYSCNYIHPFPAQPHFVRSVNEVKRNYCCFSIVYFPVNFFRELSYFDYFFLG